MAETITIELRTGNAAFEDAPTSEIARILRKLADDFQDQGDMDGAKLMDANGNAVGIVRIKPD